MHLQDHIADRLDQSVFPYVKDAPHSARNSAASTASTSAPASLRSSRPQWAERAKTRTVKEPKQRLIVFQLGGMTYSEIRSAYQVSNASNRDVFIGTADLYQKSGQAELIFLAFRLVTHSYTEGLPTRASWSRQGWCCIHVL